jgi:acetyl-CoA C-acetyltransferase
MPGVSGPHIAQACATSVACVVAAAAAVETDARTRSLDRDCRPHQQRAAARLSAFAGDGRQPGTENWVLDNFAADPWTGESMLHTAEAVAREGAMSRQALDELTLLRHRQYRDALADDRRVQRRYMQPVAIPRGRSPLVVDQDEGVHETTAERAAR